MEATLKLLPPLPNMGWGEEKTPRMLSDGFRCNAATHFPEGRVELYCSV